jgi:hypothetical protein
MCSHERVYIAGASSRRPVHAGRRRLRGLSDAMATTLDRRREHGIALAAHVEVAAMVQVPQLFGLERILARGVLSAHVAHSNTVVDVPAPAHSDEKHGFESSKGVRKGATRQTSRGAWWKSKMSLPLPGGSCKTITRQTTGERAAATCGTKSRWFTTRQPNILVCM